MRTFDNETETDRADELMNFAAHEHTLLETDHAAFFSAHDDPTVPTARLRGAFERLRSSVVSR